MNEYLEKKQVRDQEIERSIQGKRLRKFLKRLVIIVPVALLLYWLFTLVNKPQAPLPGQYFQAQSRDHIAIGATHGEYNSNPPTGGWHYETPVQTGIYDQEFLDEQVVHNLEHGHIWIAYRSDLPRGDIDALAEIAKSYSSKIIMTLRPNNPTVISVVAWEYLLNLDSLEKGRVESFIKAHRGKGPELVPDFGFEDFRGKLTPTPNPSP